MQMTPIRVMHRRSLCTREKFILKMRATLDKTNNHWFIIDLSTSAGTYVKEFCRSDCGRTSPSVPSLLNRKVDIVQLDCMGDHQTKKEKIQQFTRCLELQTSVLAFSQHELYYRLNFSHKPTMASSSGRGLRNVRRKKYVRRIPFVTHVGKCIANYI